jgi:hypothetical protein
VPLSECFAPLSVIARRVREVQNELAQEKGIQARHVFMTSDEKDPVWWEDVAEQGWLKLDHASLTEEHGRWCVSYTCCHVWLAEHERAMGIQVPDIVRRDHTIQLRWVCREFGLDYVADCKPEGPGLA